MLPLKALLLDLSGTLHIGNRATPSAVEALHRLRLAGIPFQLCSNTSKESQASLGRRLRNIGFNIDDCEILTSLAACSAELKAKGVENPLFLLSDSAMEDFAEFSNRSHGHDCVVVGLAPDKLSYANLNRAFRVLMEARDGGREALLFATNKAMYIRAEDGGLSLGPGPFVTALESAANVRAQVIGKPSRAFFEIALRALAKAGLQHKDWHNVAVVGDDVETDLGGGALELNLQRILVKTGKYRPGDELRAQDVCVEESFASMVDRLLQTQ